jgi:hypothetical protein
MKAAFLVLMLLLVAQTTSPQIPHSVPPGTTDHIFFESGNDLLRKCQSGTPVEKTFCIGYIIGVIDMVGVVEVSVDIDGKREWKHPVVCLPIEAEAGQIRDVIVKYLVDHPERRDQRAAQLIVVTLIETWKCPAPPPAS